MVRAIPEWLRRLRDPWFGPEVPADLQSYVRFSATLLERNGEPRVWRYMSGGAGTVIEDPIEEGPRRALSALMEKEYFAREYSREAEDSLSRFLASRGVALGLGKKHVPAGAFRMAEELLRLLPEEHVGHPLFTKLTLGGWGHGPARCSEYSEGDVHMFTFAVTGARRNFAALLLHEMGHATRALAGVMWPGAVEKIRAGYRELSRRLPPGFYSGDASLMPFAVDFLYGAQSRMEDVMTVEDEFVAEVYLMYVVQGRRAAGMIDAMPDAYRTRWVEIYAAMKEIFGGVEYE